MLYKKIKKIGPSLPCYMFIILILLCNPVRAEHIGSDMERGIELLKQGELKLDEVTLRQAETIFTRWIKEHPEEWPSFFYRARVNLALYSFYSQVKLDPATAATCLNRALSDAQAAERRNPRTAEVHALLGRIYQVQMMLNPVVAVVNATFTESPALKEYHHALAIDPRNAEAELGLGTYYLLVPRFMGGDPQRSLKYFQAAVKDDPKNAEAWTWLSAGYRETRDISQARESLNKALALAPDSRFARSEDQRLRQAEKLQVR